MHSITMVYVRLRCGLMSKKHVQTVCFFLCESICILALYEVGMSAVISCKGRLHLKACQKSTYFALSAWVSTGSLSLSLDSFMILCLLARASVLSGATSRSVADRASMPRSSVPDLFKPSCGSCFSLGLNRIWDNPIRGHGPCTCIWTGDRSRDRMLNGCI